MLFNSVQFLIFFPIVLGLYFILPLRARLYMLLGASYYFYMAWRAEFALLIVISTAIDYFMALQMGKRKTPRERRPFLLISLLVNLGMLFCFKYYNFAHGSLDTVLGWFNYQLAVPQMGYFLPVGISFYTFQTIGYSMDVFRGEREPERDWTIFALYVSFFPQLVAGPIERARRLIPQFHEDRRALVNYDRLVTGFSMILWGFFMKLVLADNVAIYVNRIYAIHSYQSFTGGHYLIAMYLFAYQVFCDFAGYSCIAIGTARIMGFDMMQNFRRPYFSRSFSELWSRWHISLMTWFRDYIYRAMHRKGGGIWRVLGGLFVVYMISGFWHGAAWTFVAWSIINWGFVALERLIGNWSWAKRIKRPAWTDTFGIFKVLEMFVVFSLFAFAGIYFRAQSMDQAHYMMRHLFDIPQINISYLSALILPFTSDYSSLAFAFVILGALLILEGVHWIQEVKFERILTLWEQSPLFKGVCLIALLLIILMFGNFNANTFVYFQF